MYCILTSPLEFTALSVGVALFGVAEAEAAKQKWYVDQRVLYKENESDHWKEGYVKAVTPQGQALVISSNQNKDAKPVGGGTSLFNQLRK